MKLFGALTSLLLFCFWAKADCHYSDGTKVVTLKEGQSVSLRTSGQTLESHQIQDQDGLSTCYANTATVLLKSVLPSNPDVSYTHAAVMSTTRGWRKEDWSRPDNKYLNKADKSENFTSFGWVCETIAGLKNAGGACPKNLSVAESKQLWDADLQSRLFLGLGKYFDSMNQFKDDPLKMELLKNDLSLAIEIINNEEQRLVDICEERKQVKFPLYSAVEGFVSEIAYRQIAVPSECNQMRGEALKTFLSSDSVISEDRFQVSPNEETLSRFSIVFNNDPVIAKDLESYLAKPEEGLDKYPALIENISKKFIEIFPFKECPESEDPLILQDLARSFIYQVQSEKENPCKNLLYGFQLKDLFDPSKNPKLCVAPTNTELLLDAIRPLFELHSSVEESLIPTLLNPESRYANQIVSALMPGCMDKSKLLSLQDVSCSTFPFCAPRGSVNDNYTYNGPPGECYSESSAKRILRMQTLNGIGKGRATGVSVCTKFMEDPNIKTNFCRTPLPNGEKNGRHAMSITGYRCQNSKVEYEIVNSWGDNCVDSSAIECQKDEYGYPTGPFWVKEDNLLDNTVNITTVLKRNK